MPFSPLYQRSHNSYRTSVEMFSYQFHDLFVGIVHHLLSRSHRISRSGLCIKQPQEIADFRYGPDRRTRVFIRRFLLDRHDRTQPCNLIYIGALHCSHKLTGIRRESLHITTLSLGIDSIESQRRFSTTRQSRNDCQAVTRYRYIYIFQIVLPRTEYFNLFQIFYPLFYLVLKSLTGIFTR